MNFHFLSQYQVVQRPHINSSNSDRPAKSDFMTDTGKKMIPIRLESEKSRQNIGISWVMLAYPYDKPHYVSYRDEI
jgi:hypothetical protein